jgi:hypothetical protein
MIMPLLGVDNIAVAFALGPLQFGPRRTLLLGLTFAAAEAGMTMLGASLRETWLPALMTVDTVRPGVLATLAVALLGLAWIGRRPADFVTNPWTLMGLALLLGVDNLIAGASSDAADVSTVQVVAAGALVGTLAAAACVLGGMAFWRAPRWRVVSSALMLLVLAAAAGST